MDVSIIIVNYNVKHFLRQCLTSIKDSTLSSDRYEIWVVDNASIDQSVEMVKTEFPDVHLIANKDNVGFSRANNQAIEKANGDYILLLNPDTILREDTLLLCLEYMTAQPTTGALGVKMIDGSGRFLPESKRGLPTIWNSFCKLSGLSSLFKHSRCFSGYTLSYLPEDEIAEIDVLCGAFMMMPNKVIEEVGSLDERFFMYGEDIDLSYRIQLAGYKIIYLPHTEIIHFKGESTKKGSLSYIRIFYEAMILYVKKHYTGAGSWIFVAALKLAIWLRAIISFIKSQLKKWLIPIANITLLMSLGWLVQRFWAIFKFNNDQYYADSPIVWNILGLSIIIVVSNMLIGGYQKNASIRRNISGVFLGTILGLAIYGLLDAEWRTSRAILLIIGFLAALSIPFINQLLSGRLYDTRFRKLLIIGNSANAAKIRNRIENVTRDVEIVGAIHPDSSIYDNNYVATIDKVKEIVSVMKIDELIFSKTDIEMHHMMKIMRQLGATVKYKIGGDDMLTFVGSHSKNAQGEIYSVEIAFAINQMEGQRTKRLLDIGMSLIGLAGSPLIFLTRRFDNHVWKKLWDVLTGEKTFVGYQDNVQLPRLKPHLIDIKKTGKQSAIDYARFYSPVTDIIVVLAYLMGKY